MKVHTEKYGLYTGYVFTMVHDVEFMVDVTAGVMDMDTVRVNPKFAEQLGRMEDKDDYLFKATKKFENKTKFETLGGHPAWKE